MSPIVVNRNFSVVHCDKLVSLEGAPKLVRDTFDISNCINIKSLKGLENTEIGNDLCLVKCYGLNDIEDIIKYIDVNNETIDINNINKKLFFNLNIPIHPIFYHKIIISSTKNKVNYI